MWFRLRHIAMLASDIDRIADELCSVFGLEVAFVDPRAKDFGLENRLMPVGGQFLEVLRPIQPKSPGASYMRLRGGNTGWVVICQTDDHPAIKERVRQLGLRIAWEWADGQSYSLCLLDYRDTGGPLLEIDWAEGGEDPAGPWAPAGDNWRSFVHTEVVRAITAAELESPEPEILAERWSTIFGLPIESVDGVPSIRLQNAFLRFVLATDGRPAGLRGVDLEAVDVERALDRARERDLQVDGRTILVGGMRFRLV